MTKIFTFILLVILNLSVFAQQADHRVCGTTEYMHELELHHPEIAAQRQLIEQHSQNYMLQQQHKTRTIITIPVVVHVVYNLNSQNISDAQINSQIAVLNKDFRKLNTDFTNTPGCFQPLAADCQIEFVLAKRDPNGDSTTGITRTYTATTSFSANNNIKNAATGGKNAWPATQYLNIWVGKLAGGLLGYGQFPGGPAATDGVVISYRAFGTTGAALAPFNKGRTTTHEIGHWLNLYHISGDDGGTCNGTDLIEDTPNQGAQNTGVPVYPRISCNNAPFGDMYMNYMDYTDDVSMTMFSVGQKQRMDALFANGGFRVSLLSSPGGQYPAVPLVCGIPANINVGNLSSTSAQINWDDMPEASAYNVAFKKVNDTVWTTMTPAVSQLTLPNLTPNTNYECKVQTVCAGGISAFSAVTGFATMPVIIVCSNNYEANNSITAAITIPHDSVTHSMIYSVADNDYYKVEVSQQMRNVRISLTDLPQDYDIYFYNDRGNLISTSQAGGLSNEQIVHNSSRNAPSTYHIRVKGYNGAFSNANCYALNIETSATAFKESLPAITEPKPEFILFPVPANDVMSTNLFYDGTKDVVCNIYNSFGYKISSKQIVTQKGVNEVQFATGTFAPGMYLLEVIDSEERRVQKFHVNR